jgi:hypothetical protein
MSEQPTDGIEYPADHTEPDVDTTEDTTVDGGIEDAVERPPLGPQDDPEPTT